VNREGFGMESEVWTVLNCTMIMMCGIMFLVVLFVSESIELKE
jgi:hypothetical protein